MAFIYAGNRLLSPARVGRTLLSAAFELGVVLDLSRVERQDQSRNRNQNQLQRPADRSVRSTLIGLF